MTYDLTGKRIWVAGHRGMVGGAVVRRLASEGCEVITAGRDVVDLVDQRAVHDWMAATRPDAIVLAAAKVGGIQANSTRPVDFLYDNLMIEANILHAAHEQDVERMLFLGSSCIYPKLAPQPIPEDSLLTGPLEPTNEWYAIAKIAGIKLTQAYRTQYGRDWISAMPTNLYGPGDNYDLNSSHVLPALLRKFHEAKMAGAKEVVVWGSGTPLREFLHCDDLADALVFLLRGYSGYEHVNVGSGSEVTIRALAETIAKVVGYDAELTFDATKPDGTPRKLMDSGRLHAMGWNKVRPLEDGIADAYVEFLGRGQA
ncbi:NAD-dependent epimerase/dehydratase family protein [Frigidibacter albus]|uniref:GDP-L-fucose synthase n=1 Tax=Frigidibacter albus TaxID=1465486 RepID=A0A6L8VN50_9RHOB|nr:GDP-L-fucose synthase [Frigidibacter albus]MZQ91241.1 NAD-dependent epimerase/dehydratase family protein [Frigidibacter albus]NBE33168.1 NAD-dependent epimerase/dehydratase family protein [Frigidibacter albus]GGH63417.1 GDP-L-fucose synthase [Frigidibacter albus]